ncbi:Co2+/Mg2+ efflux protein ApaG [Siccirubricoccus sp. KC 17139]|uniref:Protein ApaG n=1 Tax=Siccirubricoccus soli TaxID=2899147 RepID=A0ABT1D6T4_9PROT|nr:Co2+/Mg2+ efflux protein ApaG [Siccirubricoccus soli]MCO6417636.1 Co2+/Mg2+ efflux protein ApaG [Siccirubricoccus soli]MCP2683771.1 Co2+/Mg2+ efflux protein ApaG [Siccirubricoccus soli]
MARSPEDYSAVTRDIRVTIRTFFLADQSEPERSHYVWAYRVTIANEGRQTVQLLKRTWLITDAQGRTQRVHGDGVVGEQPVLEPGESFEYTSGTPLSTPSGFMRGLYHMIDSGSGEPFDVTIPSFSLDSPHEPHRVH